ncbi:ThiF family adenylyltransferase [Spiribacter halobius]|uniref:THIF-type NAD/FAD binding fold domain-containing protein n=1 Tax=Sediminicurvatus halobius TaxID=2182432 RepID=A0A2U2N193_9GAMM|nr:ThiF family adenylyltransferase [Spiribacter halobius]PWG62744.1 hypothetical protein DEM34_11150 [Spiribacter halobius]UEX79916.1 ThiF family adenylyltransferase [Spiribacter halobius]
MVTAFDYATAFSRNIGWVTHGEQQRLRRCRVAIAGLGGVGGFHALTLARLGVGRFSLADPDRFAVENLNRQAGATMASADRGKLEVVREQVLAINPEADVRGLAEPVGGGNIARFLDGVDLYIDGLDFFAVEARQLVFAACAERGIPAITAAPLGMGVAFLAFLPGRMTFERYFRLEGRPRDEQLLRFLVGLSPAMLQTRYLVEPAAVDLANERGPSTVMGCELCAGVAGTEALKILLGRGTVRSAPWGLHFDAYRQRYVKTWRPGGNGNPLQRLILGLARRRFMAARAGR